MSEFVFAFQVETTATEQWNLFPRFNGTNFNLDGRFVAIPGPVPVENYQVMLDIRPVRTEVGAQLIATVTLMKDGFNLTGQHVVNIHSDNINVAVVPIEVTTSQGTVSFAIIGLLEGSANISATLVVDGHGYSSAVVPISFWISEPVLDPAGTGFGRVVFNLEPNIAFGLIARVQRLSHVEQLTKFPQDNGLLWANYFASANVVFIKAL